MGIMEWCSRFWHRIRGEKKVEEVQESTGEVVALTAEPAPEPAPDTKTSDEIIQEMADSHLPAGERSQDTGADNAPCGDEEDDGREYVDTEYVDPEDGDSGCVDTEDDNSGYVDPEDGDAEYAGMEYGDPEDGGRERICGEKSDEQEQ